MSDQAVCPDLVTACDFSEVSEFRSARDAGVGL